MKNKILFVICILFGLMMLNAGLNKIFQYMPVPDDLPQEMLDLMISFTKVGWLMPLIAVVEIVGGILFMIPKLRALGAIIILPVTTGILLTHIVNEPSGLPIALIFMAVIIWVIIENWKKYEPIWK